MSNNESTGSVTRTGDSQLLNQTFNHESKADLAREKLAAGIDTKSLVTEKGLSIAAAEKAAHKMLENADIGTGLFHAGAHDGIISRGEFKRLSETLNEHKLTAAQETAIDHFIPKQGVAIDYAVHQATQVLRRLDTNHDGFVSKQEIESVKPLAHHINNHLTAYGSGVGR